MGVSVILVTVRIYYYEVFGKGMITLNLNDGATIKDLLSQLGERFGADFEKNTGTKLERAFESFFRILLNGSRVTLQSDAERGLKDGDELVILRPISGGRRFPKV